MNKHKNFENEVAKNLKGLNRRQIMFFAWICAVRALPFIGTEGHFNFWKVGKQKHLFSVLRALDCAHYVVTASAYAASAYAAYASADAAYAVDAADAASAYAAYASADAASAAYASASTARDAAYAAYDVANKCKINLYDIILNDIMYIKTDSYDKLNNDIDLYGNVWGNFQKALENEGCSYWGKLYENIFKSRFTLDEEGVNRRLFEVPKEIQEQGAKAVADYLIELEKGSENLNEARIIILGEKGAGKTCLALRLINPNAEMTKAEESTTGVETTIWKIKGNNDSKTVNAHIWDFAGHVITHAAHRCFLSERCLYIIVYNGRTEEHNRLEYWLDHVKNYGGNASVRVLINKFDDHKPDIPQNTLKNKYPFIIDFVYFSIDTDKKELEKFRAETSQFVVNNPTWSNLKIPESHYRVKNALKDSSSYDYINKDFFEKIAYDNGVKNKEEQETLLGHLHELGICLWYHGEKFEEFNTLVLSPNWITRGIYAVINWAFNEDKSMVSIDDYEKIFDTNKDRYPVSKFRYIFKLMEKYELAYSKGENGITIPHLLREDMPDPDKLPVFPEENSLLMKYVFESPLPPNTVCRCVIL